MEIVKLGPLWKKPYCYVRFVFGDDCYVRCKCKQCSYVRLIFGDNSDVRSMLGDDCYIRSTFLPYSKSLFIGYLRMNFLWMEKNADICSCYEFSLSILGYF